MPQTIWQSTATHIGSGAAEMFEAGVYILFCQPCPDALAEVSLVHAGSELPFTPVKTGDEFCIGDSCVRLSQVGHLANPNLEQLGHFVIYLNAGGTDVLPGAVKAEGTLPSPAEGDRVWIRRLLGNEAP